MISPRRIGAVAGMTVRESTRKRVAIGMVVCSVVMTLALGLVARSMQAAETSDLGLATAVSALLRVVAGFTWVLALFISITAIPPEIERRTTYTLFAKPLERWEFVFGKFFGCCALLAINISVIALIVWLMLGKENPTLTIALLKNLATFFISYTALVALIISLTTMLPMVVAGLVGLGIYFLGSAYGYGLSVAQTDRLNVFARSIGWIVYYVGRAITPRINWLNTDRPFYDLTINQAYASACVLAYAVAALIVGAAVFSRREL